jgi:hypothetical protein
VVSLPATAEPAVTLSISDPVKILFPPECWMTVVWQPAENAVAKTNAFQPERLLICPFSDASDDRGSPAAAGILGSVKPRTV